MPQKELLNRNSLFPSGSFQWSFRHETKGAGYTCIHDISKSGLHKFVFHRENCQGQVMHFLGPIFSRRILEENEPDYYSGKFFFSFFFVRPQNVCVVDTFYRTTKSTTPASGIISELLQRVPPFVYSIFNVRYKTGRNYRVPPLNFFRHCATFFSKFF